MKPFLYLFVLIALTVAGDILAQEVESSANSRYNETRHAGNILTQDLPIADSLAINHVPDSLAMDTLAIKTAAIDSTGSRPQKEPPFKTRIKYKATDSIKFRIQEQRAYMYKETQVNYEDIELTAFETEFDMATKIVYAHGGRDSTNQYIEAPVFKQGGSTYDADSLSYNFGSKKGAIHRIKTQQGEGYLQATKAKRYPDGHIDMGGGKYTTCDADHPHFYLSLSKAKVIPGDQVVFGPAHMVLLDIPLPLVLPFGFFPQTNKTAVSGLIPPSIGMEVSRGLSLTNGGYYFAFSDHFDAQIQGDIYSTLTWRTMLTARYLKRYKFSGNINFNYGVTVTGEKGFDQAKTKQYSVQWSHRQDARANPNRNFSASVNYSSSSYDKEFNYTTSAVYNNTKNSSVAYQQNWPNSPFHLTTDMSISQSSQGSNSGNVTVNFPRMSFSMDRIYPFRKKESAGKAKWYEDITLQYSASLDNTLTGKEDSLFNDQNIRSMKNGFKHGIPFSINFKALKFFNITPSLNYNGVMYTSHIKKTFHVDSLRPKGYVKTDTIFGLSYAHAASPSLSISANPKFYLTNTYGPDSKIEAIRTVISPTVGVSYVPDLSSMFDYYETYEDTITHKIQKYSIYEGYVYGTPSAPGQSGSVSIGINGNVEMKVRSDKDSTGTSRKIKIIDRIDARTSYNMFADSMKWSNISLGASTTIFGINLNLTGSVRPYKLLPNGNEVDQFGPRLTSLGFNTGISLPLQKKEGKKEGEKGEEKPKDDYSYFDIPWNLSVNYSFNYSKPKFDGTFTQNLTFSGSITPTPKWSMSFSSSYDFQAKKIAYTTVSLQRDLHCWQMSLNFSPFGTNKYYFFQINVKSSTLQDLKYEKRKSQSDFSRSGW